MPSSSDRTPSNDPNLNDTGLITAFISGDMTAFQTIYRAYFEELCSYAAAIALSVDEVRDIVQDVFWATWNARPGLQVQTSEELRRYLFSAVRHGVFREIRRNKMRAEYIVELGKTDNFSVEHRESADDDLVDRVQRIIDALPTRSREILILRWRQGMGIEQIAALMGISYGSARVLHTRALAMVRERLGMT